LQKSQHQIAKITTSNKGPKDALQCLYRRYNASLGL